MLREMKHELVAIGDKAFGTDWFEMTDTEFIADARLDGDRFDPVKRVLKRELIAQ